MHFVELKLGLLLLTTIFFPNIYGMEDEVEIFNSSQTQLSIEFEEVDKAINTVQQEVAQNRERTLGDHEQHEAGQTLVDEEKLPVQATQNKKIKKEWHYRVACGQEGCFQKLFVKSEDKKVLVNRVLRHWSGKKHNPLYTESSSYVRENCIRNGEYWEIACKICRKTLASKNKAQLLTPYAMHIFGTVLHSPETFEKAQQHVAAHAEENVK